jgi:hypothetical protein
MEIDLNQFRDWVNEAPEQRSCTIDLSPNRDEKHAVWVWDRKLLTGAFVQSAAEIDLEGERRREMERRLKEAEEYLGRGK